MRPSFIEWAESSGGLYLFDKKTPTLAMWTDYDREILNHVFPGGEGPLPYGQVCWSKPKKTGKSEIAAGLHIWYALFVETPGEQYVLANDLQGSKSRVFRAIWGALEKNPHLIRDKDWEMNLTEIKFRNGSVIRAIPADARGEAGGNQSFVTVDEPWGIVHEGGVRLMTEFVPVPTRRDSTVFYTGYQGFEGQSDFWHNLLDAARVQGEAVPELAHLDNGMGAPACWRNKRLFVYWDHVGRMPWHTEDYLAERRATLSTSEFLRTWENRRVRDEDAFCTPEQWDGLLGDGLRALHVGDERAVVLAADAATKNDSTALVGCGWNEAEKQVEVMYSRVWTQHGSPIRLTETLGPEIIRLHREHKVAAVVYDPFQMAAVAEICQREGVNMVEFPQTTRRVEADTRLRQMIIGGNLRHYGDPQLREHVINAQAKLGERGLRIIKEQTNLKVDAAVALSMAAQSAVELLANARPSVLRVGENPFYY